MRKKQFIKEFIPLSNKIYRIANSFLSNPDEAKDIVQQVYLKLWDKRTQLKNFENKEAYVIKMTKNACLDKIKLTKNTVDIMNFDKGDTDKLENYESVEIVKKIIEKLPKLQKQIIKMRDIDGLGFNEIAELLELTENSIRVSLSIARKKVREEFKKIYNYGILQN